MITRRLFRPVSGLTPSSWICPSCTRSAIIPPTRQRQQRNLAESSQRPVAPSSPRGHRVPELGFDETFAKEGVRGLFSAEGFKIAWVDYQSDIINKLNQLVAGEPIENMSPKELILSFARDPMSAALFNYASAALNNHYFFDAFSTEPLPLDKTPQLQESLVNVFGSVETLKVTMLDSAASMFGPGFVWLVWARNAAGTGRISNSRGGQWRILNTYLAGTPFPEAGYRQQGVDMNSNNPNSYQNYLDKQAQIPANTAGMFGRYSQQGKAEAKMPPGGTSLMPVLCVNTWEHVWLYDYGVKGKKKYLEDWWNAVDWGIVQERAPPGSIQTTTFIRQ